jgi:hypothetical protein
MAANLIPAHATADASNRILVPKNFSDRVSWMQGTQTLEGWILLIEPGRFRLLSDEEVTRDPQLEPIRSLALEGKSAVGNEPTRAEELKLAAMVARLVPISIAHSALGWRVAFPKVFNKFAPSECNRKAFSILFSLEGYLEIWYTDVLRRAVSLPLEGQ